MCEYYNIDSIKLMEKGQPSQIISTQLSNEAEAFVDLNAQICLESVSGIILFCSVDYNFNKLSKLINDTFDCQVFGCSTAGEMTDKFHSNSIVGLVFSSSFSVHSRLIENVQDFDLSKAISIANSIENSLSFSRHFNRNKMFGLLLTDGMSLKEENVTSLLYQVLGGMDIIGGSAGDNLKFDTTFVIHNGVFYENAAVMVVLETHYDFEIIRMQHFEPTDKELIITDVDFEKHIVNEIDGEAAADAYANINNLKTNELNSITFALYPLMLEIADEWYIRAISNVVGDKRLQFRCAIGSGLPMRVAKGVDLVEKLAKLAENIEKEYEDLYFTLGFDCISRRLEIFNKNLENDIEKQLPKMNFIGFNSYGEQFNGIHFNQTLVAVIVGKKRIE